MHTASTRHRSRTTRPALLPLLGLGLSLATLHCLPRVQAAEHRISPGQAPQPVLDAAAAGDRLVFEPGLHQHAPGRHRALLYVDKPVEIILSAGATLKLADHATQLEAEPEVTTDQDAGKKLDDLQVGGKFDLSSPSIYTLRIDSEAGTNGSDADTFSWGVFQHIDNPEGSSASTQHQPGSRFGETPQTKVRITGEWQELSHGVQVRFAAKRGHNQGSVWFITYDGPEAYGIRIGHGRQPSFIENVRVAGKGTIDMNTTHNVQPGFLVKNINACVLVHGRVRHVLVEGITMQDTNRSVMCYGEHSGRFLPGGAVGEGESFDADDITIQHTRTLNPNGAAYLLGHPSFRGRLTHVRCNHNYMETAVTAIEPNFNLDGYEVIGNVIKSGGLAIHCWRHSRAGTIADNLRIHDNTGKSVVVLGAPRGWQAPEPPVQRNNRNHLGDAPPPAKSQPAAQPQAAAPTTTPAAPFGRRVLVSDYSGDKVALIAADGKVEWEHPAKKPQDVWLLPSGNILFSHLRGAQEVTPLHEAVWHYDSPEKTEVQGCQPLTDGRVLIVECGTSRLLEVARDGHIVREIRIPVGTASMHNQMRGSQRTADGRYLVSAKEQRLIFELSAEGQVLHQVPVPGDPHDVRELPNGHLLVATGEGASLLELDRQGHTLWSLSKDDLPDLPLHLVSSFDRLANGHTVVVNWLGHGHLGSTAQFFEVDANKKILRRFTDHAHFKSVSKVRVLE